MFVDSWCPHLYHTISSGDNKFDRKGEVSLKFVLSAGQENVYVLDFASVKTEFRSWAVSVSPANPRNSKFLSRRSPPRIHLLSNEIQPDIIFSYHAGIG